MNNSKKLGWQLAAIATVVTLCGTSAFAEDRHRNGTRGGEERVSRESSSSGRINRAPAAEQVQPQAAAATRDTSTWRNSGARTESRETQRYDRGTQNRDTEQSRDRVQAETRNDSYSRGSRNDSYNRNHDRNDNRNDSYNRGSRNDSYNRGSRNDSYSRGGSYNRGGSYSYGAHRGTPYYTHGRVSRLERYHGGYNVWVVGAQFPFFIPEARFRLFPFRVGIDIRLGGYYNPLGYYDYYDGPAGVYSSGTMRGVVETVDYRRGTFVLRDDVSGDFVTLVMRGSEYRWDQMRPGDYVEVSGDWTRSGVFEAYRLDAIGDGYRR